MLNTSKPFVKDNIYGAGEKLVEEVDTVLKLGENNRRKIFIDFPDNVVSYSYSNGDIVVVADFDTGTENFFFELLSLFNFFISVDLFNPLISEDPVNRPLIPTGLMYP